MSSIFPSILTTYSNPQPSDKLNSPSHSGIETNQNSGLGQVEAVIGVEGSTSVVGSLQYLIKSPGSNGGGHIQSANTGGTGQTSFNKGDLLVGQSTSVLSKLAVGTDSYILKADSTTPTGVAWGLPPLSANIYTANDVWAKPAGATAVMVICIGAGGGGAGGSTGSSHPAGSGGGGGVYTSQIFRSSVLSSIMAIGVGVGGTGGTAQNVGVAGTKSYFGSILTAYGGGGGFWSSVNTPRCGGSGGGTGGAGNTGSSVGSVLGGLPAAALNTSGIAGQGGSGNSTNPNNFAEYGGGGGGAGGANADGISGGGSLYGGGGGGGGGDSFVPSTGYAGGATQTYSAGGGASGGANTGGAGSNGARLGGGGGGGGNTGTGGKGGNGGIGGGGGGGGASSAGTGGAGGDGGNGEVQIYTF